MTWDQYFVNMLDVVSLKSKDTTKTSAIIVGPDHEIRTTGYNGFPREFNDKDKEKWAKPEKYYWIEHAERNAIYNAARMGVSLLDCDMYVSHFPCVDCGRGIIQSGIKRVIVSPKNVMAFKDKDSIYHLHEEKVRYMFRSCKVMLTILPEEQKEDVDNLWGV
jgi:dCMP deaminase